MTTYTARINCMLENISILFSISYIEYYLSYINQFVIFIPCVWCYNHSHILLALFCLYLWNILLESVHVITRKLMRYESVYKGHCFSKQSQNLLQWHFTKQLNNLYLINRSKRHAHGWSVCYIWKRINCLKDAENEHFMQLAF